MAAGQRSILPTSHKISSLGLCEGEIFKSIFNHLELPSSHCSGPLPDRKKRGKKDVAAEILATFMRPNG